MGLVMTEQQTDGDGYTLINLGCEPQDLSTTHARFEFPSTLRKDPAGATRHCSTPEPSSDGDPDYAIAPWNFAELVQQSRSVPDELKQTTATELIDTTILLENQPWYHGAIPGAEAESILKHHILYSFLVRKSSTTAGYVVSVKISDHEQPYCTHIRIKHDKKGYTFGDSANSPFFCSVPACIDYCTQTDFSLCNDSIQLQTSARALANPVPRLFYLSQN